MISRKLNRQKLMISIELKMQKGNGIKKIKKAKGMIKSK